MQKFEQLNLHDKKRRVGVEEKKELVSIIIPIYNVENYLERCIDSLLSQTYDCIELILVDDGSPDSCGEICDKYCKNDKVRVIHQSNMGLSSARNSGISIAKGDWLVFVDSDDFVSPNFIQQLYDMCKQYNVLVSQCGIVRGKDDCINSEILDDVVVWKFKDLYSAPNREYRTVAWGKLYHKSLFEELRFPVGKINEDEDTVFKALYNANEIAITHSHLYYYYMSPSSILRNNKRHVNFDFVDIFQDRINFLERQKEFDMIEVTKKELCIRLMMNYFNAESNKMPKDEKKQLISLFKRYYSNFNIEKYAVREKMALKLFHIMPKTFAFIERKMAIIQRDKYKREKR